MRFTRRADALSLRLHLAQSSYQARELESALEALTELIRREPEQPVWRERRGQVFVDLKRFTEALGDFDAAVAAQPPGFVSLGLLANRALAHECVRVMDSRRCACAC